MAILFLLPVVTWGGTTTKLRWHGNETVYIVTPSIVPYTLGVCTHVCCMHIQCTPIYCTLMGCCTVSQCTRLLTTHCVHTRFTFSHTVLILFLHSDCPHIVVQTNYVCGFCCTIALCTHWFCTISVYTFLLYTLCTHSCKIILCVYILILYNFVYTHTIV